MNRLPGLDLLRAIAILWVMTYHALILGLIAPNEVARFGWMGVDLFFALSGFLIGGQLFKPIARGGKLEPGTFYARRLFRTVPTYLVVLALYFTVPMFRERPGLGPLWQYLTFTQNLFVDFYRVKAFSHVWSLCVEEQFYLIAPLVVMLLRMATFAGEGSRCSSLSFRRRDGAARIHLAARSRADQTGRHRSGELRRALDGMDLLSDLDAA